MSYDTWKTTEPEDFSEPEPEPKECKPCGSTGLEAADTEGKVLRNCGCCGGEGSL